LEVVKGCISSGKSKRPATVALFLGSFLGTILDIAPNERHVLVNQGVIRYCLSDQVPFRGALCGHI
jgi:hypothetical protein